MPFDDPRRFAGGSNHRFRHAAGADRRSAAEFSFWLAMPTMAGAFAYDLYKSRGQLSMDNAIVIAFGFVVSFICA